MANGGLGEITPIKLQLSRENFNAFIKRHGQPVRWLSSEKCPCIGDNQKVDENCPLCKGIGYTYSVTTKSKRVELLTAPIDGIIEKEGVVWVRDPEGNEYTITSHDCVSYVDGVVKGRQYLVKFEEDVSLSGTGTAEYIADQLYRVDLPTQVEFGYVQGDLLSVEASTGGIPLTVTNIFRNYFEISDDILPGDQVDVIYTYVDPFVFTIINNNFSKSDAKYLSDINGDGIMDFPQRWEVYIGDLIVALNATQTKKIVTRSTGVIDNLPSYYPYELKSAYSIRNGAKYEFEPGVDFVIYTDNKIKWISNPPTENEQVSFVYTYNTVYEVIGDVPDPRTSENNRFPRKVALKIYTDFNRRKGI